MGRQVSTTAPRHEGSDAPGVAGVDRERDHPEGGDGRDHTDAVRDGDRGDACGSGHAARPLHRLRDFSPRGRLVAAAFGLALVAAHAYAVLRFAGDWVATGDTALMGLRSLDSLTDRIPLVGQPSTSGMYGGFPRNAFHPGPLHFYLMAPVVRLLGLTAGMLAVSVLVTGSSVLVAAWAVFRQLGARAGAFAAVLLALIVFTTGPGSLVFPVSSNISGYPLLTGAVLVWCLLAGDDRLLPLAVVFLSFAGQAHLAVSPTVAILGAATVVGLAVHWRRAVTPGGSGALRRRVAWLGGGSLLLGLALWAPVLYQEVRGDPGNLTAIVTFASDGDRRSVGPEAAARQLAHTLGWPPLLGRTDLAGGDLLGPVGGVTWVTAAAVVAALVVAGLRWRRAAPRRALLVLMTAPVAAAGLASGSNVPDSIEQTRLPFYHWVWPLTLFATLALGLAAADLARGVVARAAERRPGPSTPAATVGRLATRLRTGPGAAVVTGLALVAVLAPVAVMPALDRRSDELDASGAFVPRWAIDALADRILAAGNDGTSDAGADGDGRGAGVRPREPVVVVTVGGSIFAGTDAAVAMRLMERGVDVRFALGLRDFVADEHLVDPGGVGTLAIMASHGTVDAPPDDIPGEEVGTVLVADGIDLGAHAALVAALDGVSADHLEFGPELTTYVERGDDERTLAEMTLAGLLADPAVGLQDRAFVEFLLDHPLATPSLDREALAALRDSLPADGVASPTFRLHLVTGEEAARTLQPGGWLDRQAARQAEANGLIREERDGEDP